MRRSINILLGVLCLCVFVSGVSLAQTKGSVSLPPPVFEGELAQTSSSGHVKLIWQSYPNASFDQLDFQLEKSKDSNFEISDVLYQGDDLGTFISGLPNGDYYFRLRLVEQNSIAPVSGWSKPLWLNVEHHSLRLALWLFALGALVFVSTVIVLVVGLQTNEVDAC